MTPDSTKAWRSLRRHAQAIVDTANDMLTDHSKEKPNKLVPSYTMWDMDQAKYLDRLITTNMPYLRPRQKSDVLAWAVELRLLRTVDKRSPELIIAVIEWSQNDNFWRRQIRSGSGLRKKFDTILTQIDMQRNGKSLV